MTYVQFRMPVPRITPGTLTNLVGVAGLVAIVVAIGALTAWPWALLAAGVFAVGLTVIAQVGQAAPSAAGANVAGPAVPTPMEAEAARVQEESRRGYAEWETARQPKLAANGAAR